MQLAVKNVSKRYDRVQANKDISFDIQSGEVLAILGENGAGKTTLMRILYGLEHMDSGVIELDGKPVQIKDPKDAIQLGIGMVHQHFMLVENFTVAQNMVLGMRQGYYDILDMKSVNKKAEAFFEQYRFSLKPDQLVNTLPVGLQQRVEIMKALFKGAEILVLDEPTAVLTPQEIRELFDIIHQLTAAGKSVIFISHKLDEVIEISDRVLVLRQGTVVGARRIPDTTKEELIHMMIGRDLRTLKKSPPPAERRPILSLHKLCVTGKQGKKVKDISFEIYNHEIVGIAGVDGNGQSELIEAITGLRKPESGSVRINGKDCTGLSVNRIRRHNLAHIPEDRHARGLILSFDLTTNMALLNYNARPYSKYGFLCKKQSEDFAQRLVDKYKIKTDSIASLASSLSGGNQQKVVVARELEQQPDILVAVKPTRGVDVGATEYIHSCILAERENDRAVLLVSSELEEIMSLTDRIVVMFNGEMTGCVWTDQVTEDVLGAMMTGVARDFSALEPRKGETK